MDKRFAFDTQKAIATAWDVLWADRLRQRKEDLAYEKKVGKKPFNWGASYYVTATDVERMVRDFAQDTADGKPWRKTNDGYGGYGSGIRIGGDLKRTVRDWLLRNPRIVGHNFGRGHISGMRFRPVGQPLGEPEKKTIEKRAERRANPKPPTYHFKEKGVLLCQKARMKGRFTFRQSRAWTQHDPAKVTCKQCLNLLKKKVPLEAAMDAKPEVAKCM